MRKRNKKLQGSLTKLSTVLTCLYLLVMVDVAHPTQMKSNDRLIALTDLSDKQRQLIAIISAANRANRAKLTSFDCRYKRTSKISFERTYSGRYAFSSDRIHSEETNVVTGDGALYVKASGKAWRAIPILSPKVLLFSSKGHSDIRPICPDPWSQMDGDIGSRIDQLKSKFDHITSVKRITIEKRRLVLVQIDQRLATEPLYRFSHRLICHFSVAEGYLPVRIEAFSINESGELIPSYFKEVTKINSYGVNGETVYLPVEFHSTYYQKGRKCREGNYRIIEESVRINPELSEELFKVKINPGDQINDKDRKLTWIVPADGVVGARAPDFTLHGLSDEKVTLSKIKEDVVILDFWATWCGPCKKITQALEAVHKWANENNKSVAFYCINQGEEPDIVTKFWKERGHNIPVLLDTDGAVFSAYKGSGIPYVVVIFNGIIQNVHIGSGAEVPVLEQHIRTMINTALED
jgi:thiol-disulfide isomerase/thioredoxin